MMIITAGKGLMIAALLLSSSVLVAAQGEDGRIEWREGDVVVVAEPEFPDELPLQVIQLPPVHRKCGKDLDRDQHINCLLAELEEELWDRIKWPKVLDPALSGSRAYVILKIDTLGQVLYEGYRTQPHSPELELAFRKAVSKIRRVLPGTHKGRMMPVKLVLVFNLSERKN